MRSRHFPKSLGARITRPTLLFYHEGINGYNIIQKVTAVEKAKMRERHKYSFIQFNPTHSVSSAVIGFDSIPFNARMMSQR
jgi:hypothetical protein